MKVGSLVESTITFKDVSFYNENVPVKGVIYTVRSIEEDGEGVGIRLEEIVNERHYYRTIKGMVFMEVNFCITKFRELQPPMKISIEELCRVEELV